MAVGARHPGGRGRTRAVCTTRDPPRPRTGGGTGHGETHRVRVGSSAGSTEIPSSCKTAQGNRAGERGAPGLALPRVLPVTPPGEAKRLPGPARSPEKSDEDRKPTPRQALSPLNYIFTPGTAQVQPREKHPAGFQHFTLCFRPSRPPCFAEARVARVPVYAEISREQKRLPLLQTAEGRQCRVLAICPLLTECIVNREAWSRRKGRG